MTIHCYILYAIKYSLFAYAVCNLSLIPGIGFAVLPKVVMCDLQSKKAN